MMDVLHFLFEEDFTSVSEDHARSRSAMRDTLYRELYGTSYVFKMPDPKRGKSGGAANDFQYPEDDLADVKPIDPRKQDAFSPRTDSNKKSKIKFVDADSVPLVEQSFEGLDAPLN